jgi:hypothetical protein
MTPGLLSLLVKHAEGVNPSKLQPKQQEMLDQHFSTNEPSRWKGFRKAVKSKAFVNALKSDDRADDKMKRYAEAMYLHHAGKTSESFTVPGHSKNYTVKYHSNVDRYSCSCPDWGYARSHRIDKSGQDCKHIKMVKLELESQEQKVKHAVVGNLNTLYQSSKAHDRTTKSKITHRAYKQEMPQLTGEGVGITDLITGGIGNRVTNFFHKHAAIRGRAALELKNFLVS